MKTYSRNFGNLLENLSNLGKSIIERSEYFSHEGFIFDDNSEEESFLNLNSYNQKYFEESKENEIILFSNNLN